MELAEAAGMLQASKELVFGFQLESNIALVI